MTRSGDIRKAVPDRVFRDVISRFASGVTVITTVAHDGDHGTTASAVSSLSMDPPMLLICLNKTSDTQVAIHDSGVFGVNILSEHQGQIAHKFARKGQDKFEGVDIVRGRTGVPLVKNALAHLECEVEETVMGGTHTVFLARVKEASGSEDAPLTYFRGRFGRLESALDEATYRDLRQRVIERTLLAEQLLEIEQLAVDLDDDAQHVSYALTKLTIEDLVVRRADGYFVNPLTADAAAQLFDARCTIQIGVVEQTVGTIDAEALDELQRLAEEFARMEFRGKVTPCRDPLGGGQLQVGSTQRHGNRTPVRQRNGVNRVEFGSAEERPERGRSDEPKTGWPRAAVVTDHQPCRVLSGTRQSARTTSTTIPRRRQ